MFGAAMRHLDRALALLADQDLDALTPVQVGVDIKAISERVSRLELQRSRRIEAFDRERGHAASAASSTVSWLRNNCNMSGGAADRQVTLARQLPVLEQTTRAVESGQIGIEHAQEIARATSDLGVAAQSALLAAARDRDPCEVRQAATEIRHRVDAEGMARLAREQQRKRRLRLYNLPDGMVGIEGALPGEGGTALRIALDSVVGVPPKGDDRTQQQRNADALMQKVR